ncbi:MAG: hypothetical protein P8X68_20630, partial [Desulfobacterales bacterium]
VRELYGIITAKKAHGGILVTYGNYTPPKSKDYDLRLDPPVNTRIPIARSHLSKIRNILCV